MPQVQVREVIGRDIDTVWALVSDVESYPTFMESVEAIEVVEGGEHRELTRWQVRLRGSRLTWVEEDLMDPVAYRLTYRQIEGDLARFEGYWQLEASGPAETVTTLFVDFDIGIPLLADMLNPVASSAIRDNALSMLRSLGQAAGGPDAAAAPADLRG